ncbi:hypothetical protein VNO78_35199 [Psophocarpus tetragonolobus]|uniref:Uncharacterized protein n=1 Tax=Psophocarpus tetragonolobus TaxID=3891 RepID=A0AAN9NM81_PSOTE
MDSTLSPPIIFFHSFDRDVPVSISEDPKRTRVQEDGSESPQLIDGKFGSPFLSSQPLPPGSGSGKGQRKDLTSKQSLEFSLIRTGLARK